MDIRKLQRVIVDALEDVKAQDIQVFNTEEITSLFDRVIIASGTSNRQTRALASSVRDAVKAAGHTVRNPEGEDTGEWVLVDCGDAVVHIMQPTIRAYYRLEELWGAKPVRVKLGSPKPAMPGASPSKSAGTRATRPAAAKSPAKGTLKAPAKPAAKTAAKTPARKTPTKPAAKTTRLTGGPGAARKTVAKSPAVKSAKPATTSRTTARKAAPAKKSPARKTRA